MDYELDYRPPWIKTSVRGMPGGSPPVICEEGLWWEQHFIHSFIFLAEEDIVLIELHTFADVSKEACAVLWYTRVVYQYGRVLMVRHIKMTAKLALLKTFHM